MCIRAVYPGFQFRQTLTIMVEWSSRWINHPGYGPSISHERNETYLNGTMWDPNGPNMTIVISLPMSRSVRWQTEEKSSWTLTPKGLPCWIFYTFIRLIYLLDNIQVEYTCICCPDMHQVEVRRDRTLRTAVINRSVQQASKTKYPGRDNFPSTRLNSKSSQAFLANRNRRNRQIAGFH